MKLILILILVFAGGCESFGKKTITMPDGTVIVTADTESQIKAAEMAFEMAVKAYQLWFDNAGKLWERDSLAWTRENNARLDRIALYGKILDGLRAKK